MREKPDHYSVRAKKEGYPARSVYKLEEIQNKCSIFKAGYRILDVGASPGSWSLYALNKMGGRGFVTAVDLKPLNLIGPTPSKKSFFFIKGDAFAKDIIKKLHKTGPFNLIMSDAAPSTTGNRTVDSGRSFILAENVINLSAGLLHPGGNMVIKIFQGGDEQLLSSRLKSLFTKSRIFKPKACRKNSFETYLIGIDFQKTGES